MQSGLSRVAVGVGYEQACLHFLQTRLGMVLQRTGGANDNGVDLIGQWMLEGRQHDCVVQCKHHRKKLGPRTVRELEGTMSYFQKDPQAPLLGLLISSSPFTVKSVERATASRLPLWLLHLEPHPSNPDLPLVCRGSLQNLPFKRAVRDLVQTHWSHLIDTDGSSLSATFQINSLDPAR